MDVWMDDTLKASPTCKNDDKIVRQQHMGGLLPMTSAILVEEGLLWPLLKLPLIF